MVEVGACSRRQRVNGHLVYQYRVRGHQRECSACDAAMMRTDSNWRRVIFEPMTDVCRTVRRTPSSPRGRTPGGTPISRLTELYWGKPVQNVSVTFPICPKELQTPPPRTSAPSDCRAGGPLSGRVGVIGASGHIVRKPT